MSIKCLKCENDALDGKALCKDCFERHEHQLQAEESEDWINEQLKTTLGGFRKKTREAQADATRKKAIQLVVAGICLLALTGAFAAIMIFIPADPSPPDSQASKDEKLRNDTNAKASAGKYTFVRSNHVTPENLNSNSNGQQPGSIEHDKAPSYDHANNNGDESSRGSNPTQLLEEDKPTAIITSIPSESRSGGVQGVIDAAPNREAPQNQRDSGAIFPSFTPTETPTQTPTSPPSVSPTPHP